MTVFCPGVAVYHPSTRVYWRLMGERFYAVWLVGDAMGENGRNYYLGAILLDLNDPARVLARSDASLMQPEETHDCYDNVVFNNGLVQVGENTVYLYYGGADKYVGGAQFSIRAVLASLGQEAAS